MALAEGHGSEAATAMVAAAASPLRERMAAAVKAHHDALDASHDYAHIERVRKMAVRLAHEEGLDEASVTVAELAAYLHDMDDEKYAAEGVDTESLPVARKVLSHAGVAADVIERVVCVIKGVSFRKELAASAASASGGAGGGAGGAGASPAGAGLDLLTAVVQDADRLDAIGAIGVARCLTFGAVRGRPLHDPSVPPIPPSALTADAYAAPDRVHTSVNHFYEKLLTLKDRMKTPAGRRVAEQRHAFMEAFLRQFLGEWEGTA